MPATRDNYLLWKPANARRTPDVLVRIRLARRAKTVCKTVEPVYVSIPVSPLAPTCTKRYPTRERSASPSLSLSRSKRDRPTDRHDLAHEEIAHVRKRVHETPRPTYRGRRFSPIKLKKRSPQAVAAAAAELARLDAKLSRCVHEILLDTSPRRTPSVDSICSGDYCPTRPDDVIRVKGLASPSEDPIRPAVDSGARLKVISSIAFHERGTESTLRNLVQAFVRRWDFALEPAHSKALFGNVESLLEASETFNEWLSEEISGASSEARIGAVFLDMAAKLERRYGIYCAYYDSISRTIEKAVATDAVCSKYILTAWKKVSRTYGGQTLHEVRYDPILWAFQDHLPLLEDLLVLTPTGHPDHDDLKQAIAVWKEMAGRCLRLIPSPPKPNPDAHCHSEYIF